MKKQETYFDGNIFTLSLFSPDKHVNLVSQSTFSRVSCSHGLALLLQIIYMWYE